MDVGAGLYMYVVVVQKFTFAISSPDEFLYLFVLWLCYCTYVCIFIFEASWFILFQARGSSELFKT